MATKKVPASDKLLAKLTNLRKTLPKEEKAILDQLVLGNPEMFAEGEVAGHRMQTAVAPKVTPQPAEVVAHRMQTAVSPKVTPEPAEVVAHKMQTTVTPKVTPEPAEVVAHQLQTAVAPAITLKVVSGGYRKVIS